MQGSASWEAGVTTSCWDIFYALNSPLGTDRAWYRATSVPYLGSESFCRAGSDISETS